MKYCDKFGHVNFGEIFDLFGDNIDGENNLRGEYFYVLELFGKRWMNRTGNNQFPKIRKALIVLIIILLILMVPFILSLLQTVFPGNPLIGGCSDTFYENYYHELAHDSQGNIIIYGEDLTSTRKYTHSLLYNGTVNEVNNDSYQESGNLAIQKFNSEGNLVFSIAFGGSDRDDPLDVSLDNQDNIILTGVTQSNDFLGKNVSMTDQYNPFVIKLSPEGNILWYDIITPENTYSTGTMDYSTLDVFPTFYNNIVVLTDNSILLFAKGEYRANGFLKQDQFLLLNFGSNGTLNDIHPITAINSLSSVDVTTIQNIDVIHIGAMISDNTTNVPDFKALVKFDNSIGLLENTTLVDIVETSSFDGNALSGVVTKWDGYNDTLVTMTREYVEIVEGDVTENKVINVMNWYKIENSKFVTIKKLPMMSDSPNFITVGQYETYYGAQDSLWVIDNNAAHLHPDDFDETTQMGSVNISEIATLEFYFERSTTVLNHITIPNGYVLVGETTANILENPTYESASVKADNNLKDGFILVVDESEIQWGTYITSLARVGQICED